MKKLDDKFVDVRDIKGGLDAWADTYPTDVIPKYWRNAESSIPCDKIDLNNKITLLQHLHVSL